MKIVYDVYNMSAPYIQHKGYAFYNISITYFLFLYNMLYTLNITPRRYSCVRVCSIVATRGSDPDPFTCGIPIF